jgi:hypothetical protein
MPPVSAAYAICSGGVTSAGAWISGDGPRKVWRDLAPQRKRAPELQGARFVKWRNETEEI